MKSPQTSDGFLQIATGKSENDIVSALAAALLSGTEYAVVLTILRKTYGYRKKEDWISLGQFVKFTGRAKQSVIDAIASLERRKIIAANRSNRQKTIYSFHKSFHDWMIVQPPLLVQSPLLVRISGKGSKGERTTLVQPPLHTKETSTKDNLQKKVPTVIVHIFSPSHFMPDFIVSPDGDSAEEPKKKKKNPQPFNWSDYTELVRLIKKSCDLTTLENGKSPQDNYARHILLKVLKIMTKEHGWPEQEAIDNIRANMEEFASMVQKARESGDYLNRKLTTLKNIYFSLPEIFEVTKSKKFSAKATSHLSL